MALGFGSPVHVHHRPKTCRRSWRREHPLLYRFLLNKWYFDELYDALFVRPAMRLGRFLWRTGDGRIIDGLGPDGISARVLDVTRGVVRVQSGYLYHYAFAMLIGVAALVTFYLVHGSALMLGFGILSGLLILPLVGAAFILTLRGDERGGARQRALGGARHDGHRPSCCRSSPGAASIPATRPFQLVESHAWLAEPSASSSASTASRCRSSCSRRS